MRKLIFGLAAAMTAFIQPAYAYIGPGSSAGAIAVVFGVIASVLLAFIAVLWYPLKRLFRKLRASQTSKAGANLE